jgi:ABC-type multidrug transport system ATPase subunit
LSEVLRVDCAARAFAGRRVLQSATLRARRGSVHALVGRNGAGKSTLLRIAAGLVAPDAGAVHFDGVVHAPARAAALAARGLYYWPDTDALARTWTVRTQLAMLAARYGGEVDAAADRAGAAKLLDRVPGRLSGGERRRAELAAAYVRQPRCLLADEPFRGMSPLDAERLGEGLRALAGGGCAVVVTAHEVETLFAVADSVTWCTAGTTYELGPPEAARADPRFRREYLGN